MRRSFLADTKGSKALGSGRVSRRLDFLFGFAHISKSSAHYSLDRSGLARLTPLPVVSRVEELGLHFRRR